MTDWRLPSNIHDHIAPQSHWLEEKRRAILDDWFAHGYRLIIPPLVEFQSALAQGGKDLDRRMARLVDPQSGFMLGLRPDITPQAARIDAHVLGEIGVTRLCYADRVFHTYPATPFAEREPLQIGAEIYGEPHFQADAEAIALLYSALAECGITAVVIEMHHMGLLRDLAHLCGIVPKSSLSSNDEDDFLQALQTKDRTALLAILSAHNVAQIWQNKILSFLDLMGDERVLVQAQQLFADEPLLLNSLKTLMALSENVRRQTPTINLRFDLSDGRGYHYHNGVMFSAFAHDWPQALAHGGRYDGFGEKFGRVRPSTGFTINLLEAFDCAHKQNAQQMEQTLSALPYQRRVFVPEPFSINDKNLSALIKIWRKEGLAVITASVPNSEHPEDTARLHACTHLAENSAGQWHYRALD